MMCNPYYILTIIVPPSYKKRTCCGKSELTVFVSGSIKGIKHDELESWLRKITPLHFEHILKREASEWGHVHFGTHYDASKFFNKMKIFLSQDHMSVKSDFLTQHILRPRE